MERLMERRVSRARSFYQITNSSRNFSEKTVLQINQDKNSRSKELETLDPMCNFNSDVIKTMVRKDPIALDFYISPYHCFCSQKQS